jgi:hypothetical protein
MLVGIENLLVPEAQGLSSDVQMHPCITYIMYEQPEKTQMGSKVVIASHRKLESS